MSPDEPNRRAPTGRPTELEGTDVLDVGAVVACATVVPAALALSDPMWALSPLVDGARATTAHGAGGSARTYRAVVEMVEDVVVVPFGTYLPGGPPVGNDRGSPVRPLGPGASLSVQDRDDGFRQRRWLVERYVDRWNELVDRANSMDDDTCDGTVRRLSNVLDDERLEQAATPDPERRSELDRLLVRHLTGLMVLGARRSAGRVVRVDEDAVRAAVTADIREVRPYGVVDALAYEAVSAGSETALWSRDEAEGRRPSNFTRDDFFRWARAVSGYNRAFVTEALKSFPPTALYMGGGLTRGSKGGGYPEVLSALRTRGEALLRAFPARRLWAQGRTGTTIDEPAGPEAVILPGTPTRVDRS